MMPRRPPSGWWLALPGVALLAACPGGAPDPDACDQPSSDAVEAVELGAGSLDSVFEPWEDGDAIDVVYGPQGGAMIPLRYRVRGAALDCIAQRTAVTDEVGERLLEDAVPLRVYGSGGSYTTETHWLIFSGAGPTEGALVVVEAEVGGATDRAELWIDGTR